MSKQLEARCLQRSKEGHPCSACRSAYSWSIQSQITCASCPAVPLHIQAPISAKRPISASDSPVGFFKRQLPVLSLSLLMPSFILLISFLVYIPGTYFGFECFLSMLCITCKSIQPETKHPRNYALLMLINRNPQRSTFASTG